MTFVNNMMLIGLAAVAVPILIHLLHRGRAKVVQWGAMQFLTASLASRNRRIFLEELILLAVRCLCLTLLVLAMARPFLPSESLVSWAIVLPATLAAAMCLAVAAVMWPRRTVRWSFLTMAVVLIGAAVGGSLWERNYQGRKWSTGAAQKDIAIVIDASMSMGVRYDGQTNFDRAIDEARSMVASAGVGDAISLILAGPAPRPVIASPLTNRKEILDALDALGGPAAGPAGVLEAINAAVTSLAEGNNSAKTIVFITDMQNVGWDLRSPDRWRYLAAELNALPRRPRIIVRSLPMPRKYRNVAIASVSMSRKVVGSDREVTIDVKVLNAGSTHVGASEVTLTIDDVDIPTAMTGDLTPNAAETVSFRHRFDLTGPRVVRARVDCKDDLPADNTLCRVVNVIGRLPVLIVDGSPSARPLESAATFIEIALAPRGSRETRHSSIGSSREEAYLVEPTIMAAADVASARNLDDYRLIVLANVAKLPRTVADRIARSVRGGAGLLVAPGNLARPEFYNQWKDASGAAVMPAKLVKRIDCGASPVGLAPRTFNHPSLEVVARPSYTRRALVKSYWRLAVDTKDVSVRLGARLLNGRAFLVERRLGRGHVLMTSIALDRHDSNLHTLKPFFVPFIHEMAYFLAGPLMVEANVAAGSEVVLEVPLRPGAKVTTAMVAGDPLVVTTPSARQSNAWVSGISHGRLNATFSQTHEPGLYRLMLTGELAAALSDTVVDSPVPTEGWPFVVEGSPAESRLVSLASGDLARTAQYGVELLWAETPEEMAMIVRGHMPGNEFWRPLAVAALLALLVEILLTRWIAIQRKSGSAAVVRFGLAGADMGRRKPLIGRRSDNKVHDPFSERA